jgi:hypothetical protein
MRQFDFQRFCFGFFIHFLFFFKALENLFCFAKIDFDFSGVSSRKSLATETDGPAMPFSLPLEAASIILNCLPLFTGTFPPRKSNLVQ